MKRYLLLAAIITIVDACEYELMDPAFFRWCQEIQEIRTQPFDALINLGGNCEVAYQMRLHGIRTEALPFDWIITPFESLMLLLEKDFAEFLSKDSLVFINTEKEKHILDTQYGVKLLHDFKLNSNFLAGYDDIKKTYTRRIERFRAIVANSRHALFIRKKITKEQTIQLKNYLHILCPDNNFLLLVVDTTEHMKTPWHIEQVKNYYLFRPSPDTWKGDPDVWHAIFTDLGLQLQQADSF